MFLFVYNLKISKSIHHLSFKDEITFRYNVYVITQIVLCSSFFLIGLFYYLFLVEEKGVFLYLYVS